MKDEIADDLKAMGASPEMIRAAQETSPNLDFEVWPENWDTVAMFMRLQTQWVPSMGGMVGLNYQSVEFLFRIEGIENQREMLEDLHIMEVSALQILNSKG